MQTLNEYFQERSTPSAGSPTGLAMVELIKLDPSSTLEQARAMVNEIGASAGRGPKTVAKDALDRNMVRRAA